MNVFPEIVIVTRQEMITQNGWDEIYDWVEMMGIWDFAFRNHWADGKGEHYSFEVPDEKQRMLFVLRWS